ncbi:MAG: M23 family metallopeptidase [Nonomuraea sp.]|nr:M23 family metallopeptidase [Nonomuraea sp.]
MRSGHIGRIVALAGVTLLVSACAKAPGAVGTGGVTAQAVSAASPSGSPSVTATIPQPTHQAAIERPKGEDPVKVPPPKLSKYSYVFPVKGCGTTYQRKLLVLPKTTIWAGKGCAFVAPIGGVVDEVNSRNRWRPSTDVGGDREGRFVSIIGDDGVRYLGGHLDTVTDGLAPGQRVKAGQQLGTVGKSGNARDTGTNLYFAISWKTGPKYWWVRRGMVNPWNYLDAWQSGNATYSPRDVAFGLRKRVGETPACALLCKPKKQPQSAKTPDDNKDDTLPVPTLNPTTPGG